MNKNIKLGLLAVCLTLAPLTNAQEQEFKFISSFNDLPLYKDIELKEDSKIEFDSIWGSVIEIDGVCNCKCSYVQDYYDIIMPNLGWKTAKRKSSKDDTTDKDINIYTRGLITLTIMNEVDGNGECSINFSQTQF